MSLPADRTEPESVRSDWTVQAADTIEAIVGLVRDKATIPLRTVARALVYGLAIAVGGTIAAVLLIVAAIRALTVYLPVQQTAGGQHRVWVSYLILGGIFALLGLLLLRKAERAARRMN